MIERILPAAAASAESFGEPADATLFPEEEAVIARAVDRRRREFATGRACARAALARLGVPAGPILVGERRAPCWPPGVVGSITHCRGYAAAAVAGSDGLAALGIDAEPDEPLPDGVLRTIALPAERAMLAGLPPSGPSWERLLFCAKESVYKAWFPLTGRWLGFGDAHITLADGAFQARLLVPGPVVGGAAVSCFAGRWTAADGLLLAAVALPAAP